MKENKIIIYLSGAISKDRNYKDKFAAAQNRLEKRGYKVINPTKDVRRERGKSWIQYLKECIELLDKEKPDKIYLLKGWMKSRGATIEREIFLYWGEQKGKNLVMAESEDL